MVDVDLTLLPPPPPWTPSADGQTAADGPVDDPFADDWTDVLPDGLDADTPDRSTVRTGPGSVRRRCGYLWEGGRVALADRKAWRLEPHTAKEWHFRHYGEDGKAPNPATVDAIRAEIRPELDRRVKAHRIQVAAAVVGIPLAAYISFLWIWWLFLALVLAVPITLVRLAYRGRASLQAQTPTAPTADGQPDAVSAPWLTTVSTTELDRTTIVRALATSGIGFKEGMEIEVSPVRRMGAAGRAIDVRLPSEVSAADVIAAKHDFATRLDSSDSCTVLRPWRDKNRLLTVGLFPSDPMAGPPNASPMATPRTADVTNGIPFGTTTEGTRVRFQVIGAHSFLAGTTRIGKTDAMCLLAEGQGLDFNARQLLLDPEGLGVFDPFIGRATVIAGTSPADRRRMAQALHDLSTTGLHERGLLIKEYVRKNPKGLNTSAVTREVARDAAAGLPWQFWMLDECQTLFTDPDKETATMAIVAAYTLLSRGGKYGFWGVLSSQRPTKEGGTPPQIIGQCANRFCMAVNEPAAATAILGKWAGTGMDPTTLDSDLHKGVGYLTGPALPAALRPWALIRADWIDRNGHEPIQEYAIAQAARRPDVLPAAPLELEPELAEPEPVDAVEIERLASLFEAGEPLDWRTITDGLKAFGYRLSTKGTLVDWLARPNIGLVLARLDIDGRRFVGLRPEAVRDALDYLLEGVTEGGDGGVTETSPGGDGNVPAHQRHPLRHPRKTLADLPFPVPSPPSPDFRTPPPDGSERI